MEIDAGDGQQAAAWDVFICHASEYKEGFVRSLADALRSEGLKVWYDEFSLELGDSLRRSIDKGLSRSRFGVVVLSKAFFAKDWPQYELDGLVQKERGRRKVILPVWHGVALEDVLSYSPPLAARIAVSSDLGFERVGRAIVDVVRRPSNSPGTAEEDDNRRRRRLDLLRDQPRIGKK